MLSVVFFYLWFVFVSLFVCFNAVFVVISVVLLSKHGYPPIHF